MNKQSVDVLIGLPGAGKDTWACRRITSAALMNEKYCMISHDEIRTMLNGVYRFDPQIEPVVNAVGKRLIYAAVFECRCNCIINDSLLTIDRFHRENIIWYLRNTALMREVSLEINAVQFNTSVKTCIDRREKERKGYAAGMWSEKIKELKAIYQPIVCTGDALSEGFDRVVMVAGE